MCIIYVYTYIMYKIRLVTVLLFTVRYIVKFLLSGS